MFENITDIFENKYGTKSTTIVFLQLFFA